MGMRRTNVKLSKSCVENVSELKNDGFDSSDLFNHSLSLRANQMWCVGMQHHMSRIAGRGFVLCFATTFTMQSTIFNMYFVIMLGCCDVIVDQVKWIQTQLKQQHVMYGKIIKLISCTFFIRILICRTNHVEWFPQRGDSELITIFEFVSIELILFIDRQFKRIG